MLGGLIWGRVCRTWFVCFFKFFFLILELRQWWPRNNCSRLAVPNLTWKREKRCSVVSFFHLPNQCKGKMKDIYPHSAAGARQRQTLEKLRFPSQSSFLSVYSCILLLMGQARTSNGVLNSTNLFFLKPWKFLSNHYMHYNMNQNSTGVWFC